MQYKTSKFLLDLNLTIKHKKSLKICPIEIISLKDLLNNHKKYKLR